MPLSKVTSGHLACLLRGTIGAILTSQAIPPRRPVSDAMKRLIAVLPSQLVFILLDLYANRVPRRVGFAMPVWLACGLGFFVLAYLLCRFRLGVTQLQNR